MAAHTTLTLSGAGANFRQLCGNGIFNSEKPRKHFGVLSSKAEKFVSNKRLWKMPRRENAVLKSKGLALCLAMEKEAEDSFLYNTSEDTDEMFDDLFNKYGKVVYKRNDKNTSTAEVDDDAQSLSFAVETAKVASDVKGGDIKVLFVKPLVYWTRFFVIATAFSRPQTDAIMSKIKDMAEKKYGRVPSGDAKPNSWTLLDFGDVVVHIFMPQQREFYDLEEFYGNATHIELPFEDQPPFRR